MRELRNDLRKLFDLESAPMPAAARDPSVFDEPPATSRRLPATSPEWLERGGYAAPSASTPTTSGGRTTPSGDAAPDMLAPNAVAWSKRLAQTTDPNAFAQGAQKLEGALRVLAQRGEVDAVWTISSTMHGVASEGRPDAGSRAAAAAKLLRLLEDPTILTLVAEQLLNGPAEAREKARRLLVNGGVVGVHGLYGARVKLARVAAVRPLFVAALKDFGPKAWPVVKAALEKILSTQSLNAATLDLAEDLLFCVPSAGDEAAGHVVLKFLRWPHSNVCRAAAATIIKLWGDRAKPVFVAMVQSKEDVVRIAGIAGLRQLGAIDEHLIPRIEGILARRVPAGDELRAAAAMALGHASPSAKQPVVSLLSRLLAPPKDMAAQQSKDDAVVLAVARSLLAVGGAPYRGLVAERAERSAEPLRSRLRGLLQPTADPPR